MSNNKSVDYIEKIISDLEKNTETIQNGLSTLKTEVPNINSLITMENLVANGVVFDIVEDGVTKTGEFVKENNKFVLKITNQQIIIEDEYVKLGLLQFVSGSNPTDTYGLRDLSGNENDIVISGATSSNFVDNKFVNNGTLFGECSNVDFSKMTEMTIIMKLSIEKSNPWYALVAFGGFKLMEQGDSKFNLITPANPAWTTNVSMDAFTLGTDIEVAYTIASTGVAKVYINGLYSGTTSYDMSKLSLSSIETLFAMATNDSRFTNAKLSYLMIYNRALTREEIHTNYKYNNGVDDSYFADEKIDDSEVSSPDTPIVDKEFTTEYFDEAKITNFSATNSYYMSTTGNDSNNGTARTTPLKTLSGYISKINALDLKESTLYVEDGEYQITSAINLLGNKFGNSTKITIQGIGNKAEFTTAETLNNSLFSATTINGVAGYVYDLSGINLNYSYNSSDATNFQTAPFLICNGERVFISSYPHGDKWTVSGEDKAVASGSNFYITAKSGEDRTALNKVTNWSNVILDTFAVTPYFNYFEFIGNYSSSNGRITTSTNKGINAQPYTGGVMYRVINSKDLLTQPNEYYIDYANKKLYFIPPTGVDIKKAKIQLVASNLYNAFYGNQSSTDAYGYYENTNITFNKINFSGFRNRVFNKALSGINLIKCRIANTCDYVFNADNTKNVTIDNCRFKNNSGMAIRICNSNTAARKSLISTNNKISNTNFENGGYCHTKMGYEFAVYLETIGTIMEYCKSKHHPGIVVRWQQNDNLIRHCDFDDSCYILSDSGCMYTGRDVMGRGNVIEYNNIHGIKPYNMRANSRSGIYLDDMASGNIIRHNTVDGYAHGCQVGGGRYNEVVNNTFKNSVMPIWADQRGINWCSLKGAYFALNGLAGAWKESVWTGKYPNVGNIPLAANMNYTNSASNEWALPRGNTIKDNIFINAAQQSRIYDLVSKYGIVENNTYNIE